MSEVENRNLESTIQVTIEHPIAISMKDLNEKVLSALQKNITTDNVNIIVKKVKTTSIQIVE